MLDVGISIELFDKKVFQSVVDILNTYSLPSPVFITENEEGYNFRFNSDYEQFELRKDIVSLFEGCSLTENIGGGVSEILLAFHTSQSPHSSDGWGRTWNSDYIHKSYYLIRNKAKANSDVLFNNVVQVLHNRELTDHYVHVAYGTNMNSQEKFYVVLKKEFADPKEAELLIDKRFQNGVDAFEAGYYHLQQKISEDIEEQKKKKGKRRK